MKILITTGIYPPEIGGPAQYAKNLMEIWQKEGKEVKVKTFSRLNFLPSGVRHLVYFFNVLPLILKSDFVLALDTFSSGLPTVIACKILGRKSIIRTGGDFLWEQYVERTGKKVLLRDFYRHEKNDFSLKEKLIFNLTRWTLLNGSKIVFSTEWQRDIFLRAYGIKLDKTEIIENYYGPKEDDIDAKSLNFVASTRDLTWKNLDVLRTIFNNIGIKNPDVKLFVKNLPFEGFMSEVKNCYAVILISLGDISPNMIMDAIRYNRPFICTKEVGILPRIKDIGIFVDPLNEDEIENAILKLLDENEYEKARQKIRGFSFVHTWQEIAKEFIVVYNSIK